MILAVLVGLSGPLYPQQGKFLEQRKRMVEEQIMKRGISNQKVLEAILKVPREEFVPPSLKRFAYQDRALPIGENQTISQPYIVALMSSLLDPQEEDRVLEVGTGSGYQAAVLAEVCREVYTIEIIKSLADSARKRLERLGYKNVKVRWGDGFLGWQEYSPFDKIIITCSIDDFPFKLIE